MTALQVFQRFLRGDVVRSKALAFEFDLPSLAAQNNGEFSSAGFVGVSIDHGFRCA